MFRSKAAGAHNSFFEQVRQRAITVSDFSRSHVTFGSPPLVERAKVFGSVCVISHNCLSFVRYSRGSNFCCFLLSFRSRSRASRELELIALLQQLTVFGRRRPAGFGSSSTLSVPRCASAPEVAPPADSTMRSHKQSHRPGRTDTTCRPHCVPRSAARGPERNPHRAGLSGRSGNRCPWLIAQTHNQIASL